MIMDISFESLIFVFDLAGTVIFAITGALSGIRLKLDLLGVIVFACTVGVGGGILRDVIIGATPVAALQNEAYLISCIVAGFIVCFLFPKFENYRRWILIFDAFGLGIFTALGAAKGAYFQLGPSGMILCGVLSAVGGGILRDVMSRKTPSILVNDFYATASLAGGIIYVVISNYLSPTLCFMIVASFVIALRLAAIRYHLRLPRRHFLLRKF